MNALVKHIEKDLDDLLKCRHMAQAVGRLEEWSLFYTQGYMLKLRAMR
jgi:hypothetical protein